MTVTEDGVDEMTGRDGLLDGIEALPFEHAWGPGMALVLRLPPRGEREESVPFVLALVEDASTGCPIGGTVEARWLLQGNLRLARMTKAFHFDLARTWLDGDEAWRFLLEADTDGRLKHFGVTRRAVVSRIAKVTAAAMPKAGFSEDFRSALRCMRTWLRVPYPYPYAIFGASEAARAARACIEENPLLGQVLVPLVTDGAKMGRRGTSELLPGVGEARLSRLRNPLWTRRGQRGAVAMLAEAVEDERDPRVLLDHIAALPPEWIPTDRKGMDGFAGAYALGVTLARFVDGPSRLVGSCGGDWAGFLERCLAPLPGGGRPLSAHRIFEAQAYVEDPLHDFANRVVVPVLAAAGHAVGPVRRVANTLFGDPGEKAPAAGRVACALLYRDRAMPGCFEAAARWHARLAGIQSAMPDSAPDAVWPTLFREAAYGEVVLRPLASPSELREEGSAGADRNGVLGLNHCVATYLPTVREGAMHVVSVRRSLPGGSYLRLATAEIRQETDGRLKLGQLSGWDNAVPPREAEAAVRRFLKENPALPYVEPRVPQSGDAVADACGYDWRDAGARHQACLAYAPVLARGLRGDPHAVEAAVLDAWVALAVGAG